MPDRRESRVAPADHVELTPEQVIFPPAGGGGVAGDLLVDVLAAGDVKTQPGIRGSYSAIDVTLR
ncbi:MAG TPA: hypothetical protein PLL20_12855 [Phycisphaerae bacterium]|nr:hypothetical protein [Phycisphaerae bacterium]HRR87348.1 hypothetical protein [Phycisphaerae bacterium]